MAKGLPPPGSEDAKRRYKECRYAVIGMWIGLLPCVAGLIVFWGPVALVLLILLALTAPMGIRGQRKTLARMRSNVYGDQRS
jgi:uncharacterized membrane protein